jgi:hypothetical protein
VTCCPVNRVRTFACACPLAFEEVSAEEVLTCFSSHNRTVPGHLHCFTKRYVGSRFVALPDTILASTNSSLETGGVKPAKSDIDETDVFGLNP